MLDINLNEISVLNEFVEAEAWASYYLCAPEGFSRQYRVEAKRIGSAWVTMVPGLDSAFFNRIICLGVGEAATESMVEDAIAVLEHAGCKNYMAQIIPDAQPERLPDWLIERGLVPGRNWAKVYRGSDPAPVVSTDLRIESIGMESKDDFTRVVLEAFGMPVELEPMVAGIIGKPGWKAYLGFDGSQPVSAAAMYATGETCWLGFGSTLEAYRKRGGQGALFARRIADGLKLGCKWFVTETGEDTPESPNPSYHNMLRAGFQLAYLRRNYVHQPTADS